MKVRSMTVKLWVINTLLFFLSYFMVSSSWSAAEIDWRDQAVDSGNVQLAEDFLTDSLCSGSLGENIFKDGDFGSGSQTNLSTDPGLAPGYIYQSNPPPNDGFYTITKNTSDWGSFAAANWIDITDNSADPNGYMMVVNASFQPGVFYQSTIDNLCGNTLYEFSADIINVVEPNVPNHILPNVDFLIDGVVQYSTGNIAQDATWRTFGFSFITGPEAHTLDLSIVNNAPGGNGNDLALDNITFRPCGPEVKVNSTGVICEDEEVLITATVSGGIYQTPFYQWQLSADEGLTWQNVPNNGTNPTYRITDPRDRNLYRLLMANSEIDIQNAKCRVVSTVERLRVVARFHEFNDTICTGTSLLVGNSSYFASGTYTDELISPDGCDSIVTTHLTVLQDTNIDADIILTDPFCPGEESGSINIQNVSGGIGTFSYAVDPNPAQASPAFPGLAAGNYQIVITDAIGCTFTQQVELSDPEPLQVELPDDQTLELGDSIQLKAITNRSVRFVQWEPQELISCGNCLDPIIRPFETKTYSVTVYNSENCKASDSVTISLAKRRKAYIPNAFSPNGDGINDHFSPMVGADVVQVRKFQIYDRWGALLYDQSRAGADPLGWNGRFKNQNLSTGIYVFLIEVEFIDGEIIVYSGDLLLVR